VTGLLGGDLEGLVLPRDLEKLRQAASQATTARELALLYGALAEQHPVALVELAIGPKALGTPAAIRAALDALDALEANATHAGLYRRLIELGETTRTEVLATAAARNPAAGWLVALSELAEQTPGVTHLAACAGHSAFPAVCQAHASARHHDALVLASDTGRPEPAAALLSAGEPGRAVEAAARALAADPSAPVVPYLAATAGPRVERLLLRLVPRLKSSEAATNLRRDLFAFPTALDLLDSVLPGMR